jgi:hypothetical protein
MAIPMAYAMPGYNTHPMAYAMPGYNTHKLKWSIRVANLLVEVPPCINFFLYIQGLKASKLKELHDSKCPVTVDQSHCHKLKKWSILIANLLVEVPPCINFFLYIQGLKASKLKE